MLLEGGPIRRKTRPRALDATLDDVFTKYRDAEAPDHVLACVPGGVLTADGVVLLPDGQLVGDTVTHMHEYRSEILGQTAAYVRPLPARRRPIDGDAYSLVIGNAHNYFHWLLDVMSRLPAAIEQTPDDLRFVMRGPLAPFHESLLDVVGLGDVERILMGRNEAVVADRLWFPSPYLKPMLHTAAIFEPFARRCRANVGVDLGPRTARIYVRREGAAHWNVTNGDEVGQALADRGFTTYDLATLDVREQIALFSTAEVVVGTGAGLANLIFAPPGTTVVQLQDPSYPVGHHYTISDAMDQDYWYFFCEGVHAPGVTTGRSNLRVPPERLAAVLDAAGV